MILREAIERYVLWRRAHGAKFTSGANLLRRFLDHADGDSACDAVTTRQVLAYLAGEGPPTRHRENRFYALAGFWRHAISRGHAARSPMPVDAPRSPVRAPPYIYSRDELARIFDPATVEATRRGAVQLDAVTFRTLLLLLYGAGLRFGEATSLTLADVDLANAVLTIRATKFYKSRLVPVGPQLATVLDSHVSQRRQAGLVDGRNALLLANQDGTRLASSTVQAAFDTLRRAAGVHRAAGGRKVPRLHDLRHSFAVHRLTSWYRQGADVQRLLPVLSTYLGHADLEGTKVYLSMTPELLEQASLRFAHYAAGRSACLTSQPSAPGSVGSCRAHRHRTQSRPEHPHELPRHLQPAAALRQPEGAQAGGPAGRVRISRPDTCCSSSPISRRIEVAPPGPAISDWPPSGRSRASSAAATRPMSNGAVTSGPSRRRGPCRRRSDG